MSLTSFQGAVKHTTTFCSLQTVPVVQVADNVHTSKQKMSVTRTSRPTAKSDLPSPGGPLT